MEIIIKDSNIESVKMVTEFLNWLCPVCNKKHRTIEWEFSYTNKVLWCDECKSDIKFSFESATNQLKEQV